MKFLGSFGIDIKLLIAQIINFGILLLLLIKFLYKPIIKKIDEEEEKLELAEREARLLIREKENFYMEKERILREAKERARFIIQEAQEAVKKLKEQERQEAEKEIKNLFLQAEKKLESQKLFFEKKIFLGIKSELENELLFSCKKNLSLELAKELQGKIFFPLLKEELKKLSFKSVLTEKTGKEEKKNKSIFPKKRFILLEAAFLPSKKEKAELEEIVASKLKALKADLISYKINKDLLSGFRLEVAGFLLENNLWQLISDSFENALKKTKKKK